MSVCPNCNTNNKAEAAFCCACGTKLVPQPAPAQAIAPGYVPPQMPNYNPNPTPNYAPNSVPNYAQPYVQNNPQMLTQNYDPNPQTNYAQAYVPNPAAIPNNVQNPQMGRMPLQKKLHCPNCKSTNITITTESSVTGAVTTGRNIRTTHVSNYHRNFWVCSDCGTKFRNIQSLEDEIHKCRNYPKIYLVLACISVLMFIVLFVKVKNDPFAGFFLSSYVYVCLILSVVFLILGFWCMNKLKKMREEASYLQQNCFD